MAKPIVHEGELKCDILICEHPFKHCSLATNWLKKKKANLENIRVNRRWGSLDLARANNKITNRKRKNRCLTHVQWFLGSVIQLQKE